MHEENQRILKAQREDFHLNCPAFKVPDDAKANVPLFSHAFKDP